MANIIVNPFGGKQPVGSTLSNDFTGIHGEKLVSDAHGTYFNAALNGNVFTFSVAAATIPVNASNLVSKFSILNPVGSGKVMELISCDAAAVLATTVVDGLGLYFQTGSTAIAGLGTLTAGTPQSGYMGSAVPSVTTCYTAATHTGTPTLHTLMHTWAAVTSTAQNVNTYNFNGKVLVPPGTVIALAMTTTVWTTSGLTLALSWAEHPI